MNQPRKPIHHRDRKATNDDTAEKLNGRKMTTIEKQQCCETDEQMN